MKHIAAVSRFRSFSRASAGTVRTPRTRTLSLIALALMSSGCFEKKTEALDSAAAATETAAQLTGDDKGAAADNPVCALFKPKELEAYVGEPLGKPENAAMGTGCQWPAKDGTGDATIQVVPRAYFEPHKLADTYKEISDLGEAAFSEQAYDGWLASALVGDEAISVMAAGAKATRESTEALLRETIRRKAP